MIPAEILKLASAMAAEANARQGTDFEATASKDGYADAILARKKSAGHSAGLLIRRPVADEAGSAAASAVAAKTAAILGAKFGVLTLLASRPPAPRDAASWGEAAARIVALLEKTGVKPGGDLMTLDETPAGSPFDYASWAPQPKGGLTVDVFYRSGAGRAQPKNPAAEEHWLILLGEDAPSGKAVGRAFTLDVKGNAVCRAWWAVPKGDGFTFRRF
jgi:hypothetical protein